MILNPVRIRRKGDTGASRRRLELLASRSTLLRYTPPESREDLAGGVQKSHGFIEKNSEGL
jgi:hypothetical protein